MGRNLWDAEWEVTEPLVRLLLNRQFPQLSTLKVQEIGNGWDNTVYRVGDEYVFRFPRRDIAITLLNTEAKILPKLEHYITIPYAKPLFFGKESEDYPAPFLGYTYLPGKFPIGISDEARMQSAATLARFLKNLHAFPVEIAQQAGVLSDQRNLTDLAGRKDKMLNFLSRLTLYITQAELSEIADYLQGIQLDRARHQHVLIHGDLHFKNMLVDDAGKLSGIIDWGDINIGHPACDLSIVYSFLPPASREAFYDIYGEVDEETKILARMIAVYIPMLIFIQAIDEKDETIALEAKSIIQRAIAT
ncbi:aminoglycoside phosphotransferase family protein [Paenibacillus sp. ISL-20]|uniref:aminoglycoside phosphotransferase family protein n=1 Tax=Paenibacillus sp. ISL-20 TaxID=2819163 RepID=UPI001BEB9501|nr:aminoglycoside phosphotransferase family protein [Paenibacillus sp. ISL-20]MBT2760191.1 aminoglycoside phosphotransferase family protein [Paenibacillus sp. ISL-20]